MLTIIPHLLPSSNVGYPMLWAMQAVFCLPPFFSLFSFSFVTFVVVLFFLVFCLFFACFLWVCSVFFLHRVYIKFLLIKKKYLNILAKCIVALLVFSNGDIQGSNPPSLNYNIKKIKILCRRLSFVFHPLIFKYLGKEHCSSLGVFNRRQHSGSNPPSLNYNIKKMKIKIKILCTISPVPAVIYFPKTFLLAVSFMFYLFPFLSLIKYFLNHY